MPPHPLVGCIVKHNQLGLARIEDLRLTANPPVIRLAPLADGTEAQEFSLRAVVKAFDRQALVEGSRARKVGADCACTIEFLLDPNPDTTPWVYGVLNDDGVREDVSERELEPLAEAPASSVQELFGRLSFQSFRFFRAREELFAAFVKHEQQVNHLTPLLASRVDVYPHQASVAGVILLDSYRRYLLADEVGLGKTIEAGLIAQDVLANTENPRILVVCPGALTLQWLAELYGKFGGRVFTVLDLGGDPRTERNQGLLAIASTSYVLNNASIMMDLPSWDLLIVDEAHQLIHSSVYQPISAMSEKAQSLLLLSALPARQRSGELYQLLRLLDPAFYGTATAEKHFETIYNLQETIGRRIRVLERRARDCRDGQESPDEVVKAASRLRGLEVIAQDAEIHAAFEQLEVDSHELVDRAQAFAHLVADRYRINRRVFRNRRERLVEEGQMPRVARRLVSHSYVADGVEVDAVDSVVALIRSIHKNASRSQNKNLADFGIPLARLLLQGSVDPATAADLASALEKAKPLPITDDGRDLVSEGHLGGYTDFELRQQIVFAAVRDAVDEESLRNAVSATDAWMKAGQGARVAKLLELLRERAAAQLPSKCLVFAGHPGFAEELTDTLRAEFGDAAVAEFRFDLSPTEKEDNVLHFRRSADTWLLVADETGGEGRNFQFVSEIFHFDLPWNASALEQRIGRLDRIGRSDDVVSHVITAEGSIEHAFLHCMEEGLGIFRQSISGLELALRVLEDRIVECVMSSGEPDALRSLAAEIHEQAAEERATDDADAVLDAASWNQAGAAGFRTISDQDVALTEQKLMDKFVGYWKQLAPGGVRRVNDDLAPGDVLEFDADRAAYGGFELPAVMQHNGNRRFQGAFKRAVVQDRPELQFFAPANAFFDAVLQHARTTLSFRVYAVELEDELADPWVGLEVVCRAVATPSGVAELEDNPYWRGRLRQLFPRAQCSIFVHLETGEAGEDPELLAIRKSLSQGKKPIPWHNLKPIEVSQFARSVTDRGWKAVLDERVEAAGLAARELLEPMVEARLEAELIRIESELQRLSAQGLKEAPEWAHLQAFKAALSDWRVEIESLGLFSRNGGLRATSEQ